MEQATLYSLLDKYDEAWEAMRQERISGLSAQHIKQENSSNFRPLFMRIADLSFQIIEGYQEHKGTHIVPIVDGLENRLDTDAIRTQLATKYADA